MVPKKTSPTSPVAIRGTQESLTMVLPRRLMNWLPKYGSEITNPLLAEVILCLEGFGSITKVGNWLHRITIYRAIDRKGAYVSDASASSRNLGHKFLGIAFHDHPSVYFFVIPLPRHLTVLEADANIQILMSQLGSFKHSSVRYFQGFQYRLGDFQLKVGKCFRSAPENFRGIVLEIEYLPLSSMEVCRPIMKEFFGILQEEFSKMSVPGHLINIEAHFERFGLQDYYTAQHTALQYSACLFQLGVALRGGKKHDLIISDCLLRRS
ncbi:mediator of RNA polymerase II transcription subunit 20a-like isoform X1 [Zingiber officinale]|uniref:Mediator of RNA polymerase II transcription subunit 20 n=1 Tax=Zingiber officinale TaxID=94328 RepID=A0A8J5HUU4_ZINOF|nr:mediator of RNA polymerase II transcription subunit 20a-like isoform X1 [Zingiber officinale]KAG6536366.1 hypothetical protein ZIOFF_001420 [Zingiber officinale]